MKNYICCGGKLKLKYLFVDTKDYLADSIFYKHKIPVKFCGEWVKDGEPYIIISCKIKKKHRKIFENSFNEVANKIMMTGHSDYEQWCEEFIGDLIEEHDRVYGTA